MFKEWLRIKKFLKSCPDKSFRLVNKDPKNINSAVYKKERLWESETECNYISITGHRYFGVTIAYQDVDAYAERDMEKTRDMGVGMLPPKLAQIMINLWSRTTEASAIYDPFCWLGTILIEAANMGYTEIFGSDISREMVDVTKKSIADFVMKKDLKLGSLIFEADASKIATRLPDAIDIRTTTIVTEWYLGDVLNARTVSDEKIREQWRKLARIYDGFFRDLRTIGFRGDIVISFPFWELRGKNIFFEDITLIIDRYRFTRQPLLDD
ncbi:MAG: putative DNA methylase, partial [uncultured bacterium (gcode 4)]